MMSTTAKTIPAARSTETIGTVVLGFGPQSMDWISKACKPCGKGAVLAPDIARMAGANLAAGDPAALDLLRGRLEAGSMEATAELHPEAGRFKGAIRWLAMGERGSSSEALFQCLTGIKIVGDARDAKAHPMDPGDLRRCLLMLEAVQTGTYAAMDVAAMSSQWAALHAHWRTLFETFEAECPDWRIGIGKASKTYALMKQILA